MKPLKTFMKLSVILVPSTKQIDYEQSLLSSEIREKKKTQTEPVRVRARRKGRAVMVRAASSTEFRRQTKRGTQRFHIAL